MTETFDPNVAAQSLLAIRRGAPRIAGLTPPPPDTEAAYAVQRAVVSELGGGSWKIALLAGRDRHAGALPSAETVTSGATISGLPDDACIEVETALILGADLPAGSDVDAARAAIAEIRLAFEIVASRFVDRKAIQPLEGMCDCFNAGGIVLGDRLEAGVATIADSLGITLWLDEEQVEATEIAQPMPDAIEFLSWLSVHAEAMGQPLRKGDVIITGARIGPLPLGAARSARAQIGEASVFAQF